MAGAIPIIKVMRESMIAAGIKTVYGIVNGTTNYILTKMYNDEGDYADILKKAQELGYAEADPTADVGGGDAAAKMAILGSIAFHSRVKLSDVAYEGIQNVTLDDVRYAKDLGFVVKLIGAARLIDGRVSVRVFPALVPKDHPLASINGANNAVFLQGTEIGEIMLMGPGAGGQQTATAVVSDIVSITNTKDVGFLQSLLLLPRAGLLPGGGRGIGVLHQDQRRGRVGRAGQHRLGVRGPRGVHRQHDPEGAGSARPNWCSSPTRPKRRTSSPPSRR